MDMRKSKQTNKKVIETTQTSKRIMNIGTWNI